MQTFAGKSKYSIYVIIGLTHPHSSLQAYANAKWYDWEEDMCLLSTRFPELLFCLHGEGESGDDLWDAYFFEGKCQHCPAVITYEDFDPSKLCAGRESADTRRGVYHVSDSAVTVCTSSDISIGKGKSTAYIVGSLLPQTRCHLVSDARNRSEI